MVGGMPWVVDLVGSLKRPILFFRSILFVEVCLCVFDVFTVDNWFVEE